MEISTEGQQKAVSLPLYHFIVFDLNNINHFFIALNNINHFFDVHV